MDALGLMMQFGVSRHPRHDFGAVALSMGTSSGKYHHH
jgi:hypothetical protein